MKIMYNFASRSRPDKFFAALDNIRAMSKSDNYFIVAKLDTDDPSDYSRLKDYPEVIPKFGVSKNKVHAINRDLTSIPYWGILCNHSDDMVFVWPGFDEVIRQHMERDCFLHFPDHYANERLSTYSIMDRVYYDRFGYVYNPVYKNVYCDNEANDIANILGRYKYVNNLIFRHEHPCNGHGVFDEQYTKTQEKESYHKEASLYHERKRLNFFL